MMNMLPKILEFFCVACTVVLNAKHLSVEVESTLNALKTPGSLAFVTWFLTIFISIFKQRNISFYFKRFVESCHIQLKQQ